MLPVNAINMEEELEAASTLLSLSDTIEDTLEEEDDNALLMPIGCANVPVDVAPHPLRLDQVSVDKAIAGLVETEQLEDLAKKTDNPTVEESVPANPTAEKSFLADSSTNAQDQKDSKASRKGSLKTKMYVLKKKPDNKRTFKCSECKTVETSIQKLNKHHR